MISTSSEYQTSIAKRTKRRTYGKVMINFTDPFVDQSITITPSSLNNASFPNQTADGIEDPTRRWFGLDGASTLEGNDYIMPPSDSTAEENLWETGWWSAEVSDGSADFSSPQTLTVEFVGRTIESLKAIGDSIRAEYPVDFTVKLYDITDTLLHTETVTGNTIVAWTTTITPVDDVTKEVLAITKWSHAGRCAKILEFFTSVIRTYEDDAVISIELTEERDVENASLPFGNISSNQIVIRLDNHQRIFDPGSGSAVASLTQPNRKIIPYIGAAGVAGAIEYIPLGVFWSGEWVMPDDDIYVETVGLDLLNLMAQSSYTPGLLTNKTLYEIIEAACLDFGLTAGQYWIDSDLDVDTIPYAYINNVTYREAIRIAAEAGLASAYCDRDGVLRVEGPGYLAGTSTSSVRTIAKSEYFSRSNPSRYAQVANVVHVATQPLVADFSPSAVYTSETLTVPASGTLTVTAFFIEEPVISPSTIFIGAHAGVTITGETYYAWGGSIELTNSTGAPVDVTLSTTGTVLRVSGSVVAEAQDTDSITTYGRQLYTLPDNPLIQDFATAQAAADAIVAGYADAYRDLAQEWRGDPALELSDRITTDRSRAATADYWLVRQRLSWDGTLRVQHDARRAP